MLRLSINTACYNICLFIKGRGVQYPIMEISKDKLAELLSDAAEAHHVYKKDLGHADKEWAKWYAEYILKELS